MNVELPSSTRRSTGSVLTDGHRAGIVAYMSLTLTQLLGAQRCGRFLSALIIHEEVFALGNPGSGRTKAKKSGLLFCHVLEFLL